MSPCPATTHVVLGVRNSNGADLQCGLAAGHRPPHRFRVEWFTNDPTCGHGMTGPHNDRYGLVVVHCPGPVPAAPEEGK